MYKNFVCVTDRKINRAPFLQQIETICALRPKALILREKDLTETEYMQLAQKYRQFAKPMALSLLYIPSGGRDWRSVRTECTCRCQYAPQ